MKYRVTYYTVDPATGDLLFHKSPWYDSKTLAEGAAMLVERDEATFDVKLQPQNEKP